MALTDTIREPGKFEGEPEYVRDVLWPMVLDGASDETLYDGDSAIEFFFVDDNLRREYELSANTAVLAVWERTDGFVMHRAMSQQEFDRVKRAIESAAIAEE